MISQSSGHWSELASILAWFPKATGMPVSLRMNKMKGICFSCRLSGLNTDSFSCSLLLQHKTEWSTPSRCPKALLRVLFNFSHSRSAPYPRLPGNISALSSQHLDHKNCWETLNKLHSQLSFPHVLSQCPGLNCSPGVTYFPAQYAFIICKLEIIKVLILIFDSQSRSSKLSQVTSTRGDVPSELKGHWSLGPLLFLSGPSSTPWAQPQKRLRLCFCAVRIT